MAPRKAQPEPDFASLIGAAGPAETPATPPPIEPDEIVPPPRRQPKPNTPYREIQGVIYESRIRVLDAWQYPGNVPASAPDWVDRNWIGWADFDNLRDIPAGPCLRVPLVSGDLAICRAGDYVARQEVLMMPDFPGDVRIEVWPKLQFEKLFMPSNSPQPVDIDGENDDDTSEQ